MKLRITFEQPIDVTGPRMDGVEIEFPFLLVDANHTGLPEEQLSTQKHRIMIAIEGSRVATWHLSFPNLIKVLFEFAKRHLVELLSAQNLPSDYTIQAPMITVFENPGECPFSPNISKMGFVL